jgi:hypothetical protein
MSRNQKAHGLALPLPNVGAALQAPFEAAEHATRMAGEACTFAMSMNRTWLELWTHQLLQMFELPKRFAETQRDLMKETFDDLEESVHELSDLATRAKAEAEHSMKASAAKTEELVQESRPQTRAAARTNPVRRSTTNTPSARRARERPQKTH